MDVKTLINVVDGKLISGNLNQKFNKVSIDTRTLKKDNLFIALNGKKKGSLYIDEAIKKGCRVVITEEKIEKNITVIQVRDCYQALNLLAKNLKEKYNLPLIAVTGSVGKTLTKDLISDILNKKYKVLKSYKNYNNHLGLPLTLLNLNDQHDIIVCELGMNHLGEIEKLSKLCNPSVGVITNIGTSHIGNLGSKKNILRAKKEIIKGMNNGPLVINGDDKLLRKIKYPNLVTGGFKKNNDLVVKKLKSDFTKTKFQIKIDNQVYDFTFNIPGWHLINNVVLAIQVGLLFNVSIADIQEAIKEFKSDDHRFKINKINDNIIIDDSYNSSYESVIGGINLIKKMPNRKVIILGDILELGKYSYKIHNKILRKVKKIPNSTILLVGNQFRTSRFRQFSDVDELIKYLNNKTFYDTLFYIKGSRKIGLEKVVEMLKK